jgi:murein DD-endopeptidase MepM/ murein hydrolase activator NlpD
MVFFPSTYRRVVFSLLLSVGLTGCAAVNSTTPVATVIAPTIVPPTAATFFTATHTSSPTSPPPTATVTAEPPVEICSPLEGFAPSELSTIITNPLATPHPGLDDGHHGVDFAFWSRPERPAMRGLPIQSILPGVVAASFADRPPYGNAIIIETRLEQLPVAMLQQLSLPAPVPTIPAAPAMVCPTPASPQPLLSETSQSIYLLYAHMVAPPSLKVGEAVRCGQVLGGVGTTGMSVNDHLHLEARIGKSDARFESLAFYIANATNQEMVNYCSWRISQQYQIIDPMQILQFSAKP